MSSALCVLLVSPPIHKSEVQVDQVNDPLTMQIGKSEGTSVLTSSSHGKCDCPSLEEQMSTMDPKRITFSNWHCLASPSPDPHFGTRTDAHDSP